MVERKVMNKKPTVRIDWYGPGGNSVAIITACRQAARRAGWKKSLIEAFTKEATSYDRRHLVDVVFECFNVEVLVTVALPVDRDSI